MDEFKIAMTAVMECAMANNSDNESLSREVDKAKAIRKYILYLARNLPDPDGDYVTGHIAHVDVLSAELEYLDAKLQAPHSVSMNTALDIAWFTVRVLKRTRTKTQAERESIANDLNNVYKTYKTLPLQGTNPSYDTCARAYTL